MTVDCGPFRLNEKVGEGAMGEVWRATHRASDETVALKFATALTSASRNSRRRFREEVRAHAALEHPGVARVFDYSQVPPETEEALDSDLVSGVPYLVMEFAPGGTLQDRVPPTWHELRDVLVEILDTLAFAHARDVVHRDLKPSNILWSVDSRGEYRSKLADFGLAYLAERRVAREGEKLVSPTAGTPAYMAPEQFRGEWRMFGAWTDLYQLGAIAWEWATGAPPFTGENWIDVAFRHLDEPLPEFEPRLALPEGFEDWVRRLLEKDPVERHRRAADAARPLARLELGDGVSVPGPPQGFRGGEPEGGGGDATRRERPGTTKILATRVGRAVSGSADGSGDSVDARDSGAAESSRAIPESWETPKNEAEFRPLVGVGRNLFGLREVPFVDRDHERDLLWQTLHDVRETNRPHVLLVDGRTGAGKSRLVEWFVRRAHEVGAVDVLRAFHTRQGSPGEGLAGMIEDYFRAWELAPDAVEELVFEKLQRWVAPHLSQKDCRREAAALANLVAPHADEESERDADDLSRFVVLEELLGHLSRSRQALVWLDDVQWGGTALRCLEYFLDRTETMPVTLVLTARTSSLEGTTGRILERIRDRLPEPRFRRLHLESMSGEYHAEMVRALLPLTPSLTERVCRRTEGNPLFAVQLVGDWVARGLLAQTDEGFELETGEKEAEIPDAIHGIWRRRNEAVLETLPSEDCSDARRAVQLAAALGRRVDDEEWHALCRLRDVDVPVSLVESLVKLGLAESRPGGWNFIHSMLVDSIERTSRCDGNWEADKRACATLMRRLYPSRPEQTAMRRCEYLIEGGDLEGALDPLSTAMRVAVAEQGNRRVLELIERRSDLMDRLELDAEDRRRVQSWSQRAGALRRAGMTDEALEWSRRAVEVSRRREWSAEAAEALLQLAFVYAMRNEPFEGLKYFDEAEEWLRSNGDEIERAVLKGKKISLLRQVGRLEEALESAEEAREMFQANGLELYSAFLDATVGYVYLQKGAFERAREGAEMAIERGRRAGRDKFLAVGLGILGEVELCTGRPRSALDYCRRSESAYGRLGNQWNCLRLTLARAWAELVAGESDAARSTLRRFYERTDATFRAYHRISEALARATIAALDADWSAWDRAFADFEQAPVWQRERSIVPAWCADHLADATFESGAPDRALRACRFARDRWAAFNRQDFARRADEKIERMVRTQ